MNAPLPGLGFFATALESARQTLLRLREGKRVWIVALVIALMAAGSFVLAGRVAAREHVDGRTLFCVLAWWVHVTVLLPWATMYFGVHAIHGQLEDRTFQYLFVRPVARSALLLGNWLAVGLVGGAIGALGTLALFAGVASRDQLWPDGVEWQLCTVYVLACAAAAVAYAAVAALFSAALRRPLVWAAVFVVGLQMLTANLPVSAGLRSLTITDPVRRFVLDRVEPNSRLAEMLWPAEERFRADLIGEPMTDLAWLTLVCLGAALWIWSRTEYEARDRE